MIDIGSLRLENKPAHAIGEYTKMLRFDRERLKLSFQELYTWSCDPAANNGPFPKALKLKPVFHTTSIDSFGQVDDDKAKAIYDRLVDRSGFPEAEFLKKLHALFPVVEINVPQEAIKWVFGKYYKVVVGYWRHDTHHLLLPNPNPNQDFVLLSLPSGVQFAVFVVGQCGNVEEEADALHSYEDPPFEIYLDQWTDPDGLRSPRHPLPFDEPRRLHYWRFAEASTPDWTRRRKEDYTNDPNHTEYDEQEAAAEYGAKQRDAERRRMLKAWSDD